MIITLKKNATKHDVDKLINKFEKMNLQVTMIQGDNYNVFGLVGDTSIVDEKSVLANPIVYNVQRVAQPYKLANRMFHPEDTIVDVNGIQVGGKKIAMIAGPCSVEGEEQTTTVIHRFRLQRKLTSCCFSRRAATRHRWRSLA